MDVRQFIIDGEQIDVKDVEARENIGDLSELETTAKDSLVSAINELENTPAGISDYNDLSNKPSINGVTLSGNKTTADLNINVGIESYNDLADKPSINNVSLVGDIDTSDLNIDYDDLSNRPVESGNVDMDSIVDPLPPIATEEKVLFDERGTEYTVGWYINSSAKRKPVYRKDIYSDSTTSANSEIAHNISDIEKVIKLEGCKQRTDAFVVYTIPSTYMTTSGTSPVVLSSISMGNTNIEIRQTQDSREQGYFFIRIEYTKTTDSWEDIPS